GLVLVLAGWGLALWHLYRVYARASKRTEHETLLNFALGAAWFGIAAFLAALLGADAFWFQFAREAGLWLFLVPTVFLVAHRMVPFFSQSGLINYIMVRPAWGPSVMVVCVIAHLGLELANLGAWRFLADLPLAVAALHHTWVWQFRRTFHARLVAMLHVAFLWLGIGMTLFTLQSVGLLVLGKDIIGRAALHALGIGFFTGMIVAMASRVTLGHSGRQLHADTLTWGVLMGVNLSAVLRIAGEFLPQAGTVLNLVAAVIWLVSLGAWVARYAPIYVRPRPDGVPG
ncbi:MAG: NnrS family protein, partial [Gammaproteobacteria bacterium]|nr:NnrS family protein [Gammaproteobacteria bacterium]